MKALEAELLEQLFYNIAKQCDDVEEMVWVEQDLIRVIADSEPGRRHSKAVTRLVRSHVDRAWQRVSMDWQRNRARLQLAIFDEICPAAQEKGAPSP